jgi:hypothetical protein
MGNATFKRRGTAASRVFRRSYQRSPVMERVLDPSPTVLAARLASVLVIGLMAACAAQLVQIPQPVGPAPIVVPSLSTGRLVVYTEEISSAGEDNFSASYEPYTVLDSSQHLVREVSNFSGEDVVPLQAGQYFVRAHASGERIIVIEVQIVAGRATEVHLDGKWRPEASDKQALVFGPDDSPVGYRSGPVTGRPEVERNP